MYLGPKDDIVWEKGHDGCRRAEGRNEGCARSFGTI